MQNLVKAGFGILIAVVAYFTGAVTDVGGALTIAVDKNQQVAYCQQLVQEGDLTVEDIIGVVTGGDPE